MSFHCPTNDAAGSIATQDVGRPDLPLFPSRVDNGRLDAIVVLLKTVKRPAEQEVARLQVADRLPQHVLDQWLGDLLSRLRKHLASLR